MAYWCSLTKQQWRNMTRKGWAQFKRCGSFWQVADPSFHLDIPDTQSVLGLPSGAASLAIDSTVIAFAELRADKALRSPGTAFSLAEWAARRELDASNPAIALAALTERELDQPGKSATAD